MSANGKSHLRYIQAEEALAHLLETGGYRPGDQLPPEPTLARQLGVSRATLREALRSFDQQGSISRRQGVGTFVNPRRLYVESGLEVLISMEDLLAGRGVAMTTANTWIRQEAALPKAAKRLKLPEGAPLTVISRTYLADGQPVAYLMEAAPATLVDSDELAQAGVSLLAYQLSQAVHAPAVMAQAHLSPVLGTPEICAALSVLPTDPIMFLEQTVFNTENCPICYARTYYVPDFFDFHVIRRSE
ncbi:MAG: GntR family transcriptional regulator [Caldilineaceae bacterium]|nr:GntR family transcriptional regulator [Caldilineaceae bacterium]MBP8108576.1 GntR family transcriptional regulator [Caldilineaceae bacterium]MBP8124396.1 GntR family transcriptional regulator [Caldilineaceae bacterium]MBP9071314.1 GntR family transcriptional regulator [Caldilineaceae bacterium]